MSPKYDEMRPRILKNSADYDKLRDAHLEKEKRNKEIMETVRTSGRFLRGGLVESETAFLYPLTEESYA